MHSSLHFCHRLISSLLRHDSGGESHAFQIHGCHHGRDGGHVRTLHLLIQLFLGFSSVLLGVTRHRSTMRHIYTQKHDVGWAALSASGAQQRTPAANVGSKRPVPAAQLHVHLQRHAFQLAAQLEWISLCHLKLCICEHLTRDPQLTVTDALDLLIRLVEELLKNEDDLWRLSKDLLCLAHCLMQRFRICCVPGSIHHGWPGLQLHTNALLSQS
mmetsp:Transcript_7352/g.12686  ORF Transcript_7352/g.12686 Transcript_7352/m.12686 type:complete len:214 (-) Transcript_7352:663-1304(-)